MYTNPVLKHQNNPDLLLEDAGHTYRYYGVDRNKATEEIEEYLSGIWTGFSHFCNYKTNKDGTKSIRFLCHYSDSFIGVAYERVDTFEKEPVHL